MKVHVSHKIIYFIG